MPLREPLKCVPLLLVGSVSQKPLPPSSPPLETENKRHKSRHPPFCPQRFPSRLPYAGILVALPQSGPQFFDVLHVPHFPSAFASERCQGFAIRAKVILLRYRRQHRQCRFAL